MRTMALRMTVLLGAFAALAQNGPSSEGKATSPNTVASPLDGNWQISGNREYKQYPLISMAIHVNGKQVTARGDRNIACPTSINYRTGGSVTLTGEIGPDSSFTLRQHDIRFGKHGELLPPISAQLTIVGKVPALGATSWGGTYTITGQMPLTGEPKCILDQGDAFTASPLSPLTGTFSGEGRMNGARLKLSISAKQGDFVSHETTRGPFYYLPLTGTIHVEGSSCFTDGRADASTYNAMAGDLAHLRFKMDDGSDMSLVMVYTDPQGVGLSILVSGVRGGKCDTMNLVGTFTRQ